MTACTIDATGPWRSEADAMVRLSFPLALTQLALVAIVTTLMASPIFEAAYGRRRVASG